MWPQPLREVQKREELHCVTKCFDNGKCLSQFYTFHLRNSTCDARRKFTDIRATFYLLEPAASMKLKISSIKNHASIEKIDMMLAILSIPK